ncbi:hypothetical protein F5B18DRAFT_564873 [Nemania serpens]|nr:hypothetical protein F5B18DRAFT_564873 [Nemania serpens]
MPTTRRTSLCSFLLFSCFCTYSLSPLRLRESATLKFLTSGKGGLVGFTLGLLCQGWLEKLKIFFLLFFFSIHFILSPSLYVSYMGMK